MWEQRELGTSLHGGRDQVKGGRQSEICIWGLIAKNHEHNVWEKKDLSNPRLSNSLQIMGFQSLIWEYRGNPQSERALLIGAFPCSPAWWARAANESCSTCWWTAYFKFSGFTCSDFAYFPNSDSLSTPKPQLEQSWWKDMSGLGVCVLIFWPLCFLNTVFCLFINTLFSPLLRMRSYFVVTNMECLCWSSHAAFRLYQTTSVWV